MTAQAGQGSRDVPDHVVAAIGAVLAAILGETGAYRVTSIRPLGWRTDGSTEKTWGLAGRMEAGGVRQHFGEGRRG